jgi:hypothetical protein
VVAGRVEVRRKVHLPGHDGRLVRSDIVTAGGAPAT